MVLDKDLASDWQYAQVIREICAKCDGPEKGLGIYILGLGDRRDWS